MFTISGQDLLQWRRKAQQDAQAAGISPTEVDWVLLELTHLDRLALRLESFGDRPEIPIKLSFSHLQALWHQRLTTRTPVQYLVGVTPWRKFSLQVSPAVLIPRPETEYLIDLARERAKPSMQQGHWVDLGTGSGAIALGLAEVFPEATIHAVDWSEAALAIAKTNAENLGFGDRIQFDQGSWFEPLTALKGQLQGMVSNPPYIPSKTVLELQPEVTQHEPHLALDGGVDGLDDIRHLIQTAPDYLAPGGLWLIEMMAGQAPTVAELLQAQGSYQNIQIIADFAGIDRFALAYKRDE